MQGMMKQITILTSSFFISILAQTSEASTIQHLNIELELQKIGYGYFTIYDKDGNVLQQHSFVDHRENFWGVTPVADLGYAINNRYALVATLGTEQFSDCYLGFHSCIHAFGKIDGNFFEIFDGLAQTGFSDFYLSGGTNIGENVILHTFEGAYYFYPFDDGGYASWSSDVHVFSIVQNNLTPIPLPSGMPLLLAGIGGLGLWMRRNRKNGLNA